MTDTAPDDGNDDRDDDDGGGNGCDDGDGDDDIDLVIRELVTIRGEHNFTLD